MATLLLTSLPAATAEEAQALLHASSVSWSSDAVAETQSLLVAVSVWRQFGGTPPTETDSRFELAADKMEAQFDTAPLYLDSPLAGIPVSPDRSRAIYTEAHINGTRSGVARQLFVLPNQDGVQVEAACGKAGKAEQAHWTATSQVDTQRPTRSVDTSSSIELKSCEATITGDFELILWDWDGSGFAREGQVLLWSGKQDQTTVPDPLGAIDPDNAGRAQQVFLTVSNGVLRLPSGTQEPAVFVESLDFARAAGLALQNAVGTLAGHDLQAHTLHLVGAIDAKLSRGGNGLDLQVAGGIRELEADGQSLVVPGPVSQLQPWSWLVAVGTVLAPVAAIPLLRRRRRPSQAQTQRVKAQAIDWTNRGRFAEALPLGRKILDWRQQDPDALILAGKLLRESGDPEKALIHHAQARELLAPLNQRVEQAENSLETAFALAHLHRRADVLQQPLLCEQIQFHLEEALQANPNLGVELELHPELWPFLGRSHFSWAKSWYSFHSASGLRLKPSPSEPGSGR